MACGNGGFSILFAMGLSNRANTPTLSLVFHKLKGGDPMSSEIAMRAELVCLGRVSEQPSAVV
jgi:hypothetical protein